MTGVLDIFLYFISCYCKFQAAVANKNGVVKMIKYKNKRFFLKKAVLFIDTYLGSKSI